MNRTPRLRRTIPRALALLLPAALAVAGCGRTAADPPPAAASVPVRIAEVALESIAPPILGTGLLAPKDEITLGFKTGGVVARVVVDEGDVVRQGDTLASLEPREIDAGVARARAAADKAERDLARAQRLFADSVATREQVQDAETAAEVARAGREAAEFDRRYAVITAPADGVVLHRWIDPGELVAPGEAVVQVGSRARGSVVRVGLADRDVARIHVGDPATVRLPGNAARPVAGTVRRIAAAADAATGTFRVEIEVLDAGPLTAGRVADVEIRPAAGDPLPVIPVDALLEADADSATVFAFDAAEGRARRRAIRIAFLAGDRVAVASGLDGVGEVVTAGASRLSDGDAVEVLR